MINVVADLHLHSKYSRAVSPRMMPEIMEKYALQKGLDLLATGDFTHPMWFRELKNQLEESEEGIYKIKSQKSNLKNTTQSSNPNTNKETRFLLSVEISCIYTQNKKGRRVHNLVLAPDFRAVEKINKELINRGYNLGSDGRPIIGLSSKNLLQLILEIDERCLLIPAHIWTPWFGVLGVASGFNSLEECFEELSPYIFGIETGLSSDPEMNWQIKALQTRSILSFSDAHSPAKMGREATVFELEKLTYGNIREAIMAPSKRNAKSVKREDINSSVINNQQANDSVNRILYTFEFYPEEGKYHYSGHRICNVTMTPEEQKQSQGICPVCKRPVTDGVTRRVGELANKELKIEAENDSRGIKWYKDPTGIHPPFVKLVPLNEIISEAIGSPVASPKVKILFDKLCTDLQSEINVLIKAEIGEIRVVGGERIADGVQKVREGNIVVKPGYDGVYGVVRIWPEENSAKNKENIKAKQMGLF